MSGYYKNSSRGYYKPRYRARNYYKPQEKTYEEKPEPIQEPKTRDEGIQINLLEGIPCRIIPLNPEDYPKLLALLQMQDPRPNID